MRKFYNFILLIACSLCIMILYTESAYAGIFNNSHEQACITSTFIESYTSTCYSCDIAKTLASAFIRAAASAYEVSKEAANAVLVVCTILWIGIYVLKNITSFSTVEPRQMIQGLLVQFFKIFIAFAIINSGLPTILHYTMEPLMIAGTDFGDAIIQTAPGGS